MVRRLQIANSLIFTAVAVLCTTYCLSIFPKPGNLKSEILTMTISICEEEGLSWPRVKRRCPGFEEADPFWAPPPRLEASYPRCQWEYRRPHNPYCLGVSRNYNETLGG